MIEVFLERAKQLSSARELIQDDAEYASAIALLSVHSAIALNDALLLKLKGKTVAGRDHMEAVRETARRCRAKRLDASGVTQIKVLVSAKSAVSYGDESTSYELAVKLAVAAQRFETWVYKRMEEAA